MLENAFFARAPWQDPEGAVNPKDIFVHKDALLESGAACTLLIWRRTAVSPVSSCWTDHAAAGVPTTLTKDMRLKFDIELRNGREIAVNIELVKVAGNSSGRQGQ